ncbi:hypothetical protein FGO68_gene14936 [Halteria grandinella]|uniref:Uncharacterized protein n=1 Tax=Halteria grandinella TaxID=5974 RepID=A0A8J8T0K8_HALGN|nr:hypothetical protein FGO68_gene14936 [Halteria grandinella]
MYQPILKLVYLCILYPQFFLYVRQLIVQCANMRCNEGTVLGIMIVKHFFLRHYLLTIYACHFHISPSITLKVLMESKFDFLVKWRRLATTTPELLLWCLTYLQVICPMLNFEVGFTSIKILALYSVVLAIVCFVFIKVREGELLRALGGKDALYHKLIQFISHLLMDRLGSNLLTSDGACDGMVHLLLPLDVIVYALFAKGGIASDAVHWIRQEVIAYRAHKIQILLEVNNSISANYPFLPVFEIIRCELIHSCGLLLLSLDGSSCCWGILVLINIDLELSKKIWLQSLLLLGCSLFNPHLLLCLFPAVWEIVILILHQ